MRKLLVLVAVLALPVLAQTGESDKATLQALLTEVQQLRMAIERYTLLGTRTQIAVSQLQLQETRVSRLSQSLAEARAQAASLAAQKNRATAEIKDLEERLNQPPDPVNPQMHQGIENNIKRLKLDLDQASAWEQQSVLREADLSTQLDAAQAQLAESRTKIADMERMLDAAIQQLLKQR